MNKHALVTDHSLSDLFSPSHLREGDGKSHPFYYDKYPESGFCSLTCYYSNGSYLIFPEIQSMMMMVQIRCKINTVAYMFFYTVQDSTS